MFSYLGQLFQQHAETDPEAVALLSPDRSALTYGALNTQIRYVAETLNAYGIGRNDRVALVLPNGPDMAVAFLGASACATSAPINPGYRAEEFNFYLDDLGASAVIVDAASRSVVRAVARQRHIPVIELHSHADAAGRFSLSGTTGLDPRPTGLAGPADIALVLHTSGTTARPKMVPLTHANLCASAAQIQSALDLTPGDRCLNVMPLFHAHGLIGALLASLQARGSVFCAPGFTAGSFPGWLARSGATWFTAVPMMHHEIVQEACGHAWVTPDSRLRFVRSCSSPLPPHLMADLERTFGVPVVEAYGMTECSHQITVNPLPPGVRKPGSVGLPSGTIVAILADTGAPLAAGATGEIAIRSESLTAGYAANAEANANGFVNGWFRTGDEGYIDEDGYLFITGRLKELINRGGEKISPREVDEILLLHPAVARAVTFAAPHPTLGEEVAAAVVLRPGFRVTPQQIQEFASTHISDFKVPRRIVMLDELPTGPAGKPQRIGLAERLGISFPPAAPTASSTLTMSFGDRGPGNTKRTSARRTSASQPNVLIVDGESGLAMSVVWCLAAANVRVHVLSRDGSVPVRASRRVASFHTWEPGRDGRLVDRVAAVARSVGADLCLPIDQTAIRLLASEESTMAGVLPCAPLPPVSSFDVADDKWRLASFIRQYDLPHPATVLCTDDPRTVDELRALQFPALLKPRRGSFGIGIVRFRTAEEMLAHLRANPHLFERSIAQSEVAGKDVDCSVFCDRGRILAHTVQTGLTEESSDQFQPPGAVEFVHDERVLMVVRRLMSALNWTGVAHIDLRQDVHTHEIHIIEINPRFWGSVLGSFRAGVNFPHLACLNGLGLPLPAVSSYPCKYTGGKAALKGWLRGWVSPTATSLTFADTPFVHVLKDPGPLLVELLARCRPHIPKVFGPKISRDVKG